MDNFIFVPRAETQGYLKIDDIAGESQLAPDAVWGSDGASLAGMHVDPVIPGSRGFEDPSFGFEDPSFGFEDPSFGFEVPLLG